MVNVIVNKDGTLELTPLIANVSDKNVVESLYLTYDNQPGTLKYLVYVDDYDATHTKLVSANNTVSLNSYKSSSLQIQLKMINAVSGEIVFESQWATLQLANVDKDCDCDYPRPPVFGPCGPHTPPPHHGFKPPKNYLYDFCSKLHTALGVEITNREQGDAMLAEMVASGNSTIADTLSEVIDKLDTHISDMTPLVIKGTVSENGAPENQFLINTDTTYAEVCEAIETHRAIYVEAEDWGLNQTIPIYSTVNGDAATLFIPSTEVVVVQFNNDGSVYATFMEWSDFTDTYSEIDNISMSNKGLVVTNSAWYDSDVIVNVVAENGTISHKLTEKANTRDVVSARVGYESELDSYMATKDEGVVIYHIQQQYAPDDFYPVVMPNLWTSYYIICIDVPVLSEGMDVEVNQRQIKVSKSGIQLRDHYYGRQFVGGGGVDYDDIFEIDEASEGSDSVSTYSDVFEDYWTKWYSFLTSEHAYTREDVDAKIQTLVEVDEEVIDKVEANSLAIEKLQKKRVVGFATMKPLVEGVTSQLKLAYVGDLIEGTNYTYTLKRNDAEVISWQKQSANDTSSSVTVATSLLISEGNIIVIKDGEELVCEAELEIYNLNETIMLQLVAYSE